MVGKIKSFDESYHPTKTVTQNDFSINIYNSSSANNSQSSFTIDYWDYENNQWKRYYYSETKDKYSGDDLKHRVDEEWDSFSQFTNLAGGTKPCRAKTLNECGFQPE